MLNTNNVVYSNGPGTPNLSPPLQRDAASSETVKPITRKSQIIEEEYDAVEEEDEDEYIEEVDTFSDPGVTDTGLDVVAEPPAESEEASQSEVVVSPNQENEEEDLTETPAGPTLASPVELTLPSGDVLPPRSSSLDGTEAQQQPSSDLDDIKPDATTEQQTPALKPEREAEPELEPVAEAEAESVVEEISKTRDADSSPQQPATTELEIDMTKDDTTATPST
jgi:hypothetical protein